MICAAGMEEEALEARIKLGREAVAEQVEYFSRSFGAVGSEWKSDGSRVTEADIHLSLVFADMIAEVFPNDQFFSEELDHGERALPVTAEFSWLLDPIDGTNNYARGIPTCSISLGLLRNGVPVYGFVYDYGTRSIIEGGPGKGILIDGQPYEVRSSEVNEQSLISTQCLGDEQAIRDEDALQMRFKIRALGSSALHMAYAALGWTDGVLAHRVKSWDIAAGVAIMVAGGRCTRFFDTEVFPLTTFSSKEKGFGHIAGSNEFCDEIEKTIGRKCAYAI